MNKESYTKNTLYGIIAAEYQRSASVAVMTSRFHYAGDDFILNKKTR